MRDSEYLPLSQHPGIRWPHTIDDMLASLDRIFEYGATKSISSRFVVAVRKYRTTALDVVFFDNGGGWAADGWWGKGAADILPFLLKEHRRRLYAFRQNGIDCVCAYPVYGLNAGWIHWVSKDAKDPRFSLEATQFWDKEN